MNKTFLSLILVAMIAAPLTAFGNVASVQAASFNTAIRGTTNSTVYWYANDGKRYVFPNAATYFTWFPSFDSAQTISDSELFSIPLAGNVTYRPGAKLVKITTDPKVYAVARGGVLRHVTSESLANQLYGYDWASKVQDVPDEFFTNYSVGSPIYSTSDYNVSNEYNGVFSPSDSLRIQGQGSTTGHPGSMTLNADRTSITSGQAVYLTGTYFGTLPSGGYLEIKDVRNSNTIKTCYNTSSCTVTVYPTVDSSQNSVQYYIVAKNSNGTHIGTQYGQVIYTNGSSQNGSLTMNTDRTNITSGQAVYLTSDYNANLMSGGRIEIKEVRTNTIVKTCYNSSSCNVTVYPYQSGYSSTQYVSTVFNNSGSQIATQYSPTIYFDGSSTSNLLGLVTTGPTSITNGQLVYLVATNVRHSSRLQIIDKRNGTIVQDTQTSSNSYINVMLNPQRINSSDTQVQYEARLLNTNGSLIETALGPIFYFNGSDSQTGTVTINPDRTNVSSGQTFSLWATYNSIFPSGGRIEIKEIRNNTIVKTCYNSTTCEVSLPYQNGYASTQFSATVFNGSGVQIATQNSATIYFNGSSSQIGTLTLSADRTTVTSGQTVTLNAHYSGSFPSGGRLVINQSGQGSNPLATTLKTCYTNSCSHTTTLWSYTNGMTYPFVAIVYDASGNMIVWSSPVTVSTNDSTGSTSNDGVNFINGLTLQSDRTSAANGDMVKLTANAYNNGNWSYVGNRIEIRDVRTGSIVKTCYDQSWCVVDVSVQGNNGTAQYETRIYDRNGNFVMSQFGPVIYVSGTTSNTGSNISLTGDYTVTIPTSYLNMISSGGRVVIKRANNIVATCYRNSSCTIPVSEYQYYHTNETKFMVTVYGANGEIQNEFSVPVFFDEITTNSIRYTAYVYHLNGNYVTSQSGSATNMNSTGSTGTGSVGSVAQIPNTDIYIAPTHNVRAGGTVYLTASFTNLPYTSTQTVIRLYTEGSTTAIGTCSGSVSCSVPYTIPTSGVNTRVYGVASNSSLTNTRETARIPLNTF